MLHSCTLIKFDKYFTMKVQKSRNKWFNELNTSKLTANIKQQNTEAYCMITLLPQTEIGGI